MSVAAFEQRLWFNLERGWLGRQEWNLRMPVPKADAMRANWPFLLRNGDVIHTAI